MNQNPVAVKIYRLQKILKLQKIESLLINLWNTAAAVDRLKSFIADTKKKRVKQTLTPEGKALKVKLVDQKKAAN